MIVSRNPDPSLYDFQSLMCRVDQFLNDDAKNGRSIMPPEGAARWRMM